MYLKLGRPSIKIIDIFFFLLSPILFVSTEVDVDAGKQESDEKNFTQISLIILSTEIIRLNEQVVFLIYLLVTEGAGGEALHAEQILLLH